MILSPIQNLTTVIKMRLYFLVCISVIYSVVWSQEYALSEAIEFTSLEECDACGCSATGGAFGFGDLSQKNALTIRHLNQQYRSKETLFNDSPWSKEDFNTIQFMGWVSIHEKIKVMAIIPYNFLNRFSTSQNTKLQGIGDISITGIYQILNLNPNDNSHHLLFGGLGVKLPSGTFDTELSGSINPGFQLGTGSLDYSFLTEYQLKYKKFTWQTLVNYLLKTENKNDFKFGNQLNINAALMYHCEINSLMISPQLGYAYEHNQQNVDFGVAIPRSQGYAHMIRSGFEIKHKNWLLGTQYFIPVSQNLMNRMVQLEHRLNTYIQYLF